MEKSRQIKKEVLLRKISIDISASGSQCSGKDSLVNVVTSQSMTTFKTK